MSERMPSPTDPSDATPAEASPSLPRLDARSRPVEALPVTILQFGTGNFLRGFVDVMVQHTNDAGLTRHGIAVVQSTRGATRAAETLRRQDGRFHVVLEGVRDAGFVSETTLVTAVQQVVSASDEFERYRELSLSPELRLIVSNTTEAGIVWQADDLDARPPASFPGKVAALLRARFRHFDGADDAGLHIVCCELIDDNATTLRELVLRHLAGDAAAADWVRRACRFHDSLVDRIVPGYPADASTRHAELGVVDESLVTGEVFGLWAIVDDPQLRDLLPLDRAGQPVQFVDDIAPIRVRKVRVLNGLHTAMAAWGLATGRSTVSEAAAASDLAARLGALLRDEILPTLPGDPVEAGAYAVAIVERFGNPALHHRLTDIALNSFAKWPARLLPVVRDRWRDGASADSAVLVLAVLIALYAGRMPQARAAGFEPRDDPGLIEAARGVFTSDDRRAGVGTLVERAGWLDDDAELRERLIGEVTARLDDLDRDGAGLVRTMSA